MVQLNRRSLLAGGPAVLASCALGPDVQGTSSEPLDTYFQAVLEAAASCGPLNAGGDGELALDRLLTSHLLSLGYTVAERKVPVPFFETRDCSIRFGGEKLALYAQAPVKRTAPEGIRGKLFFLSSQGSRQPDPGAIIVVELPYARHSGFAPNLVELILAMHEKGAAGVVLVTTGPTGEAVPLNAPKGVQTFPLPVAIAGSRYLPQLKACEGDVATLLIRGDAGQRETRNLIARSSSSDAPCILVTTPKSGWGPCIGERGGGLAIFQYLADVLRHCFPKLRLLFVATGGHEYQYAGAEVFLSEDAPAPDKVRLWVHLGAGLAARDWHETSLGLAPLPSADAQRYLMGRATDLDVLRASFAGQPGLEMPYPLEAGAAGELAGISAAGYRTFGAFGAHRLHHLPGDDLTTTSGRLVTPVAASFLHAIKSLAQQD
jgi:hypothetical protein